MAEVEEVAQVLRVSLEGVQVAMQITGAFWHNGKDFLKVLWNVLHKEKLQGKTSMRDLLTRGGDLQLFQFPENAKEQIYKALKSYGVLFAELPDLNRKDGLTEVVFHAEAVPRVNDLIKNINAGTLIDMEQYLGNAEPEAMQEQRDSFTENYQEEGKSLSETEKEEIVNRMKVLDAKDNPTQEEITIAKKLVIHESDKEYFTRIPYEREKFVWISKEDAVWINEGKTLYVKLDKEREYEITDREQKPRELMRGEELYQKHYDEVSVTAKRRAIEQENRRMREERRRKKKHLSRRRS